MALPHIDRTATSPGTQPALAGGRTRADRAAPRLGIRVLQGSVLLGGQRVVGLLTAGLGSILLARWLSPEVFGTYAILWFVVALAINVGEAGLTSALIQRGEPSLDRLLSTVFVLQAIVTGVLALCLATTAPLIVHGFGLSPEAIWPLRVLALLIPLSALRTPPAVLLERRLTYVPLTVADTIDSLVFYGVAVLAAGWGAGVWSFVIGVVVGRIVSLTTLWYGIRWRPRFRVRWKQVPRTLRLGWGFQSTAFLVQARDATTPVLVRMLCGVQAVGLLNLASALAMQSVQTTTAATRTLFPALAQLRQSPKAFGAAIERALNRIAVLVFPMTFFLCAGAGPIMHLVYGPRWVEGIPALQLFCVSALMAGLTMVAIHALNSLGHAGTIFRLNLVWTGLLWGLTILLVVPFGFVGYAMAHAIQGLTSIAAFVCLQRLVPFRMLPALRVPCVAATLGAGLLLTLAPWITDLVRLGAALSAAAMVYLGLVMGLSGSAWRAEVTGEWKQLVSHRWSGHAS